MQDLQPFGKILIFIGASIALFGVIILFWGKIPFVGKLFGDFSIDRPNFKFYFPLATCILLSIILSIILWLISYFTKK